MPDVEMVLSNLLNISALSASKDSTNPKTGIAMTVLCKTDMEKAIIYLEDAAKLYAASNQSKMANRARLINNLVSKLRKLKSNDKE